MPTILQYTLSLFRKDDSRYQLRILDPQQQEESKNLVDQQEIDFLVKLAQTQYRVHAPDLHLQGQELFNWVDQHSNGWLRRVRQTPQAMTLIIDIQQSGLRHLPWELLHDGRQFLCADPLHLFTPLRRAAATRQDWQPQKRQLSILFMASSPLSIEPVLDFEAEEAAIIQATHTKALNHRIDLQVEESGSLIGLEERLLDMDEPPDILHLTGHATVREKQPMFLLEDETGNVAPTTGDQLAHTLLESNNYPRIAFLSGCRTGETDGQRDMLSFSEQMVAAGIPVVLGWALPVGDQAATTAAADLYQKLATGFDIDRAVAFARQRLLESGSPYWHLLRCYVDHSSPNPIVSKGKLRVRVHNTRQSFLDAGGQLPVCPHTEFIGRRRLLQECLRRLRALFGDPDYGEGILLHGMGGLGKSSVAARLVNRLRASHEPVVCYGGLDETVLLTAISKAMPGTTDLLNDGKKTLHQRLRLLFAPDFGDSNDKPLLLIFDDFEQNIDRQDRQQGRIIYRPASLETLNTVLTAIHESQSDSRVIITSRFKVEVALPCSLYPATPETLHDADLNKKLARLPGFQDETIASATRNQAQQLAAGNPRLLEWLDKVLGNRELDDKMLLDTLAGKEEEFREDILIRALLDAQAAAVRRCLACAALYRLPVEAAAIEALTDDPATAAHLQTASRFGLVEITPGKAEDHYFVSHLLDNGLEQELSSKERGQMAAKGCRYLCQALPDKRPESLALEIVRLAVAGEEQGIAIKVGDRLASNMLTNNRYREAEALCLTILTLGEDFRILTQLARAEQPLGRTAACEHFERAVALLPAKDSALDDEMLREKSATLFNYGDILIQQGKTEEALALYQEQVLPLLEQLGDVREKAVTMGKIADIMQARGQLDEALKIRETEQLPVYEQLGDVRSKAVTMGQIADIMQARGQLDEALKIRETEQLPVYEQLGDVRSKAVTMGQIADIMQARGQLDEALKIRETEQLPVYEQLGDVREKAVTMGQIADIMQARGQLDEALKIRETEELPVYEQLGDVREKAVTMGKIADIMQARGQLDEALKIRETEQLPVFEQLGDVRSKAVTMGKIADIMQARGQLDEALKIRETEQLPVYEQLGDVRSLLVGRAKLALLLLEMDGQTHAARIKELFTLALIDARRLQLPEAEQIRGIMEQLGMDSPL